MQVVYTSIDTSQTQPDQSITSPRWQDIEGLVITLPPSNREQKALVILNVARPYANGEQYPGIDFRIRQSWNQGGEPHFNDTDTKNHNAFGTFTYSSEKPASPGRQPLTLVVQVTLLSAESQIQAQWRSIRDSTGFIGGFASLSAIVWP